jgi:hypothetical protein
MQTISEFTTVLESLGQDAHQPAWVRETAQMAVDMHHQHLGGGVDQDEFQNNMYRLVSGPDFDRRPLDLDTRAVLVTAVLSLADII